MTTEQQQNPGEGQTPPVVDEVVEVRPTPAENLAAVQDEVADRAREEYLKQTAEARKGQADADKRYAAFDRTYLRFIDGTTAASSSKAKALAKDLGYEGDHIETRPV